MALLWTLQLIDGDYWTRYKRDLGMDADKVSDNQICQLSIECSIGYFTETLQPCKTYLLVSQISRVDLSA